MSIPGLKGFSKAIATLSSATRVVEMRQEKTQAKISRPLMMSPVSSPKAQQKLVPMVPASG